MRNTSLPQPKRDEAAGEYNIIDDLLYLPTLHKNFWNDMRAIKEEKL